MTEKQKLVFSTQLNLDEIDENGDLVEFDRSTLLLPGVHNGVNFPEEEIKDMDYPEKFPLNLDHSRAVALEVGFWKEGAVEDGKMRADPILNKQTSAFDTAMGYIQNRQTMDGTAEVSVEVFGVPDENEDGEEIFTELELDKASLVDRGAVSPDEGAGIGMNMDENFTWIIDNNEIEAGYENDDGTITPVPEIIESEDKQNKDDTIKSTKLYVPNNPDDYGTSEADWSAPTLSDFTDESFDDLSDSEKREIAAHFGFSVNSPPENFGDLKLPHHNASTSNVVWNGVVAAMAALAGARGGVDMPSEDKSAVYSHLAAHYQDDFDEEPPAEDDVLSEDETPDEFEIDSDEPDTKEVDAEYFEGLETEVTHLRNKVQELEEKPGEKWAEEVDEKDGEKTGARKTGIGPGSQDSSEAKKELARKLIRGELE